MINMDNVYDALNKLEQAKDYLDIFANDRLYNCYSDIRSNNVSNRINKLENLVTNLMADINEQRDEIDTLKSIILSQARDIYERQSRE